MRNPIIPIFIPHQGCPHQCVFCNQLKITGSVPIIQPQDIRRIIEDGLSKTEKCLPEIAYYGGSFTALPHDLQCMFLKPASELLAAGRIHSIRISTRPDYINQEILANLKSAGVTTVELGAQSLDDTVLNNACRGHTYRHVQDAVHQIKEASMKCGLQLMIGLPGEDWPSLICSAERALALRPDFFRLYPTIVINSTPLAELFNSGRYRPLTIREAVVRCAYLKIIFEYQSKIKIIRTGLQASDFLEQPGTILAGPYHPSFGEMVDSYLFYIMIARVLETTYTERLVIHYHPKDHSKLRGIRNWNILQLNAEFNIQKMDLIPSGRTISELVLVINDKKHIINPNMIFSI